MTNAKPSDPMPDEIWISTDGIYMYPSTGKKEHGSVRYTRAPQSPPVQSDEVREGYNIAKEIVQAAAGLRSKRHGCDRDDLILVTAAELSKIINSVIRAAEQRVAPQTGVLIEALKNCAVEFTKKGDVDMAYEIGLALTAHSKGMEK